MKNSAGILILFTFVLLCSNTAFAMSANKLNKLVIKSNINDTSTIAVSVKNVKTGLEVYSFNKNKLLHPASTLKIFTAYSAMEELGYDYCFKTLIYKDKQDNLYIKSGADPLLTTSQLKREFLKLKEKGYSSFNNLYFDDGILDKKEFSQGWMWDDDINPSTPKVSAYNLDGNLLTLNLAENQTELKTDYPTALKSNIQFGGTFDYLDIERYNWINPEIIEITGYLKNSKTIKIPISSMRRYFAFKTKKILDESKINIKGTLFASKTVPENADLIGEISNPAADTLTDILQNSNNLMAETLFKLAAVKKYNATGSGELAAALFNEFYEKQGLKQNSVIIKDGCGVSRNNLFSVDWVSSALNKLYKSDNFEKFKENMAQPGCGTLETRLYDLRGKAWLKTGSLSNISTIAGYVYSLDGNIYSVAVFIQNFNSPQQDIKAFEDKIITAVYNR